jgi:hypothetical protein
MLRRKRVGWMVVWLTLLLALTSSVAWAAGQAQGQGGDQVVWGGDYTLRAGQELAGALTVIGGNAVLEEKSVVRGDVVVIGGNLDASGTIRGNVSIWGGAVSLRRTAVVQGDVSKFGGNLDRADGAIIAGQIREGLGGPGLSPRLPQLPLAPTASLAPNRPFGRFGDFIGWQAATVGWALLLMLLGMAAVLLAPQHVGRVATTAAREPALSLGLGLLTLIVAMLIGGLLLIAFCLGLLVWLAALLALLLGWIAVGLWMGQRILAALKVHDSSSLLEVAIGVFLLTVLARLPWCGFLVWLVVGSLGVGAVVLTRFGTQPYHRPVSPSNGGGRGLLPLVPPLPPSESNTPSVASAPNAADTPSAADDFVPDPPLAELRSAADAPIVTDTSHAGDTPSAADDFVPDPPAESLP